MERSQTVLLQWKVGVVTQKVGVVVKISHAQSTVLNPLYQIIDLPLEYMYILYLLVAVRSQQ